MQKPILCVVSCSGFESERENFEAILTTTGWVAFHSFFLSFFLYALRTNHRLNVTPLVTNRNVQTSANFTILLVSAALPLIN